MKKTQCRSKEVLKLYVAFHQGEPFTPEDAFRWGQSKGYDTMPEVDPEAIAIRKMKAAIKNARFIDPQGRKVPQYISLADELSLWGDLTITPHTAVQRSLNMHCDKAVQTLAQAQTVADSYNDNFNISGVDVTVPLDGVADAVNEAVIMRRNRGRNDDLFDDEEDEGED